MHLSLKKEMSIVKCFYTYFACILKNSCKLLLLFKTMLIIIDPLMRNCGPLQARSLHQLAVPLSIGCHSLQLKCGP